MKRTPLKRRTPLRSRRPKPAGVILADCWRDGMGGCEVCPAEGGECSGPIDGHHVIPRRALKSRGLVEFLYDRRNRVAVCRHRHEQHESRYRPIPRGLLPASVSEFAAELGLTHLIERYYPVEGAA